MKDYIQASNRKPEAAYGAAHDQPQNRRAETTPGKSESAFVVGPKGDLARHVMTSKAIAKAMIPDLAGDKSPYFTNTARDLFARIYLCVLATNPSPSLKDVQDKLQSGELAQVSKQVFPNLDDRTRENVHVHLRRKLWTGAM